MRRHTAWTSTSKSVSRHETGRAGWKIESLGCMANTLKLLGMAAFFGEIFSRGERFDALDCRLVSSRLHNDLGGVAR